MFKTKIYTGIAIILAMGVLAMLLIYRNLGNVAGYLATLDRVSVPFSIAALEMEKNAGEYATGVLRYVSDPDPALRGEALHDIDDFTERHAVYMRLSTNERERVLGRKVSAEHRKLVTAGNALMDERDRLDDIFQQTTDILEQIDVLVDAAMPVANPGVSSERGSLLATLQNIEAETAEVGYWLTLFKHRPTASARKRLLEKVREQHDAVARLREQALGGEARRLRTALHELHVKTAANVAKLLAGESDIGQRVRQLEALAEHIDAVFDDEIQVMLLEDLAEPRHNMDAALATLQRTLRYAIPAYFLVALVIGLLLIRTIILPIKRLAVATEALGAGDLDYRIDARGGDEFGKLARQFNAMARRLRDSTVSRELLEASEQQLQQTVADLRQEMAERQRADRERDKLQAQLQRSETLAAMGQLVAGVAHEVRNPLFGISSTLDAMQASAEVGRANPRYREVLRREVNRLNKLMTELLEYGRTPPIEQSVEPLGKTLVEAIRSCQTAASAAGIVVLNRAVDDAPVAMNRDRLLQVHVNLIENAVQHAPQGSEVIVTTQASQDEAGLRWIEYSVMDRGPGFEPDDLPRLFDPFFTRRRKGTGLGLAIARRIVDEHGGTIEPANRPEGGAVLTVRLPIATDEGPGATSQGHGGHGSLPMP